MSEPRYKYKHVKPDFFGAELSCKDGCFVSGLHTFYSGTAVAAGGAYISGPSQRLVGGGTSMWLLTSACGEADVMAGPTRRLYKKKCLIR